MAELSHGKAAPDFCLPDSDENQICLKDFKNKWVVLYFYPKDNTSGCTLEAIDFTRSIARFKALNSVVVVGISPDSSKSHCSFRDKHDLQLILLSNVRKDVLTTYGVWQIKKMYGREYFGVVRSTFLIDSMGEIAEIWTKVKVAGHIDTVLEKLKSLQ